MNLKERTGQVFRDTCVHCSNVYYCGKGRCNICNKMCYVVHIMEIAQSLGMITTATVTGGRAWLLEVSHGPPPPCAERLGGRGDLWARAQVQTHQPQTPGRPASHEPGRNGG